MSQYNYLESVTNDVRDYILENMEQLRQQFSSTEEEMFEKLQDILWTEDTVTGNGSGSYTFNSFQAGENLVGNFDILREAFDAFDIDYGDFLRKGVEFADVIIRCYLLPQGIENAVDELRLELKWQESEEVNE